MENTSTIAKALAKAQSEMGKALKSANNPHFRSKYADLESVVDACMGPLNDNGIAVIQPTVDDDGQWYVKTMLIHGESGESLECRVPLIVQKKDMQGYGSAVTYARRYGLMCMTGIAPEDDDGNAAAKAAPPALISGGDVLKVTELAEKAGVPLETICQAVSVSSIAQIHSERVAGVVKRLNDKIAANEAGDENGTTD